jgi:hypothetical protein
MFLDGSAVKERKALDLDNSGIRYPTWLDWITLAALTAALVACYKVGWITPPRKTPVFESDANSLSARLHDARHILNSATPFGIALAIAGFARVLREPRPARSLLFRQPGVAACAALVAALITAGANTALWLVRWIEFREQWLANGFPVQIVFESTTRHLTICVIAAWAYLAFGGAPARAGANWVNWLGGTLGILAVFNTLLWYVP